MLIELIRSTLGIVMGVNLAYILTGFAPSSPEGAATHVTPIFLLSDVSNVWILSVILSLAARIFQAWKISRSSLNPIVFKFELDLC